MQWLCGIFPKRDATQQAGDVLYHFYAFRQLASKLGGIAAAQVDHIGIKRRLQLLERLPHTTILGGVANLFARDVADALFVGAIFGEGMVRHLDVGAVATTDKEREAHAGPQRHHQLNAMTRDRAEALNASVVKHAHRLARQVF